VKLSEKKVGKLQGAARKRWSSDANSATSLLDPSAYLLHLSAEKKKRIHGDAAKSGERNCPEDNRSAAACEKDGIAINRNY
jgi:hypothetical protein